MSRTPRQPSPRTAKPRVDSTSTPTECKCHFRNSWFRCVTNRRLTKVIALEGSSEESLDLEFAVGKGQLLEHARTIAQVTSRIFQCEREIVQKNLQTARNSEQEQNDGTRLSRAQELKLWSTVLVLSTKACNQASCDPGQMSDQDKSR